MKKIIKRIKNIAFFTSAALLSLFVYDNIKDINFTTIERVYADSPVPVIVQPGDGDGDSDGDGDGDSGDSACY